MAWALEESNGEVRQRELRKHGVVGIYGAFTHMSKKNGQISEQTSWENWLTL